MLVLRSTNPWKITFFPRARGSDDKGLKKKRKKAGLFPLNCVRKASHPQSSFTLSVNTHSSHYTQTNNSDHLTAFLLSDIVICQCKKPGLLEHEYFFFSPSIDKTTVSVSPIVRKNQNIHKKWIKCFPDHFFLQHLLGGAGWHNGYPNDKMESANSVPVLLGSVCILLRKYNLNLFQSWVSCYLSYISPYYALLTSSLYTLTTTSFIKPQPWVVLGLSSEWTIVLKKNHDSTTISNYDKN